MQMLKVIKKLLPMWVTTECYVFLFISYFLKFTTAVAFLGVPAKL